METTAPIELRRHEVQVQAPATPDQLLQLAVDKNLDIDKLEKLMELQERYNKDMARKAFFAALGEFQANVPEIRKTKQVVFKDTKYNFAPLSDIVRQIKDECKKQGLSYRWEA